MANEEAQNDIQIEATVTDTDILESQASQYAGHDLSAPSDQIGNEGDVRVVVDDEGQVWLYAKANGTWHSQLLGGVDFGSDVVQQTINNIVTEGNIFENQTMTVGNLIAETVQANQQYKDSNNSISSQELVGHPDDNTQAHTDYLKNNAADTLQGTLKIEGSVNTSPTGTFSLVIGDGGIASEQYNLVVGNPDNVNNTDGSQVYHNRIGFWTNEPTSKLHMNTSGDGDLFHVFDAAGQIAIGTSQSALAAKLNTQNASDSSPAIAVLGANAETTATNFTSFGQTETGFFTISNNVGDIGVRVENAFRATQSNKDLGTNAIKWGMVFADELLVETLVSQEVFATMGGRITVAPSTVLFEGIDDTETTLKFKHNNFANGDFAKFKIGTDMEVIQFTSGPSNGTDGDGNPYYSATVTRAVGGTATSWAEGASVSILVNVVGSGYIELTATSTADQGNLGPTQVFNTRVGTATYNDYATSLVLGNLNGAMDYSTDTFGIAIGDDLYNSGTQGASGITIDESNGLRMRNLPIKNWHYEADPGAWYSFFDMNPTAKQISFGFNTDVANTSNFRFFGSDTTYNTQSYNAGDILFGSTSTGLANFQWKHFQAGGSSAQNILRIGTGTGLDAFKVNADGSGSAADGNISWDNSGNLTLTGTLTNIDDQIGDVSGANVFYQATQPDHTSTPVPVVGDLWYDTDAGNKPHYLQSIADTDGSGTAGDDATDFLWTDIFYTEIDGSHISTGTITAVNLESFEVTTDSQGTIPGQDTGVKVFEIDMGATPVIKQYEKQDSPNWGSELSGGSFKFHFFESNGKTTYDYVKAQQMINAKYQQLNVTQTFTNMNAKKMPDDKYVVIPVEARMPDLTISSSYCDDNSLDNYLGYVFSDKTKYSFKSQLIVYYGEESGWMRIPYTVTIGHNFHEDTAPIKQQMSSLDSPVLLYPPVSATPVQFFGGEYCGGEKFGYLYNRLTSSTISASRGIYPNQVFQWGAKFTNSQNGGWNDWNDGTLIHGGNPTGDNNSLISNPTEAGDYRFNRFIPNQQNDCNYYASGAYDDPIFGNSREGWRNGPLWRDVATQTSELANSDYDNSGTGNLQELENASGETFNAIKQGRGHTGAYNSGSFTTVVNGGVWSQPGSNYAEPIYFGNSESASTDTNFYGQWLDPDNDDAVWRTGINLLRWRSRAHIVYKAHEDNDSFGMHWCYETYTTNRGEGHIAWGAVVQGNCWNKHASGWHDFSTSEFGSPNHYTTQGKMFNHYDNDEDLIGPVIQVVPHADLSMAGEPGGSGSGTDGTMYRSEYGFVGNAATAAQVDENLYWHYRNGNGQISWYESDNHPQGQIEIDGDDWYYIVKLYERQHLCASGIDDQGMWAPI